MTETNEKVEPKPIDLGEYKYGFHDDVTPVFSTGKGISEDVVRAMSAEKGEPEWMLEFRTWLREWLPKPLFNLSKAIMRRRGYTFFSDNR